MPTRPLQPCTTPGCPALVRSGPCARHSRDDRPSAAARGYDGRWRRISRAFLRANPTCCRCGARATQSDHYPTTRAALIAAGVPDPDAWYRLRPLCAPCHSSRTARTSSGWGRPVEDP